MMIVISYRRNDSEAITGRIFDRLIQAFGRDAVFRDIDSIPVGSDFRDHIGSVLRQSSLLVAIVGPRWLGRIRAGGLRVDDATDLVRIEVEMALETDLPIIPVLVGDARMPDVARLPESLQPFAFRNAIRIDSGQDFDNHIQRLIRIINGITDKTVEASTPQAETDVITDHKKKEDRKIWLLSRSRLWMYAVGVILAVGLGIVIVLENSPQNRGTETAGHVVPPPIAANPPTASAPLGSSIPEEAISTADAVKRASDALGRKDYAEAMRWYRQAADGGDADSQSKVGLLYENGWGVEKNPQEAVRWFRLAADQGSAEAETQLGLLYANGQGVPKDHHQAAIWYQKAADKNYPLAQSALGMVYALGWGVPKDADKALEWLRKASDQGDSNADLWIGLMYLNGNGVARDYAAAMQWFRKSADKGNAGAYYQIGIMHISGSGVTTDYYEAMRWLQKSIDSGNQSANSGIGLLYAQGLGVHQDYVEALRRFHIAANANDNLSEYEIGLFYQNGWGVPVDYKQAMEWFLKSTETGFAMAQNARLSRTPWMDAWAPPRQPIAAAPPSDFE
jgi:TPR repeat protein